jgi:hypothetical protein
MIERPCYGIMKTVFALAIAAAIPATAIAEDKVVMQPLHIGASLYFGQMFNIEDSLQDVTNFTPTVTLPYTSLWIFQQATYKERFHFNLGIAGSFWYPFPEFKDQGWTSYRTGGVAIAQANGSYTLGELDKPWLEITVGQQGYKYNPYAKNFGEYLFRSEAYPTTVRTGDWGAIDNAGAGIWGIAAKGNFADGLFSNDFLMTLANERSPLHDISLTNISTVRLGKVFQVGAGVTMSRLIQFDPKKSKPEKAETGWFAWTADNQAKLDAYIATQLAANPNFFDSASNFKRKTLVKGSDGLDSIAVVADKGLEVGKIYWAKSERPLVSYLSHEASQNDAPAKAADINVHDQLDYVDTRTIFAMGRFAFDPKPLFGLEEIMSPNDLVLYGEAAVIGFKNYPVYYRNTSERTPMTVGFYLPTFRALDYLTVEMEYFKNPHMNSDVLSALFRSPQPKSPNGQSGEIPDIADPVHDRGVDQNNVNHTSDDIKWTVTGQKSFGVWSLAGQLGNDHFRPLTGGFRPSLTEAATTSDAWYYMVRLMVNL